jgi:hypothetical protein
MMAQKIHQPMDGKNANKSVLFQPETTQTKPIPLLELLIVVFGAVVSHQAMFRRFH